MLQRIFRWTIGLPVAVIVISFAVANRQWVTVSFDPFSREAPFAAMDVPLWVLFFCGIFFGMVAGWTACWFAQGKWRRSARDLRRELKLSQARSSQPTNITATTEENFL